MKKFRSINTIFLILLMAVTGLFSCKDMMDFHQEYVKNGEIVYLAKVDSITSYAGKNRVQISGYLNNGYNINKVMVYWNNKADSLSFDFTKTKERDSLNLIIPNLLEKSYFFDVYTVNQLGQRSIKVQVPGTVYGQLYRNSITPRVSNGFNFDGKNLTSLWFSAEDQEKFTEIKYTHEVNGITQITLPQSQTELMLPKLKHGTTVSYRTIYTPEKLAIDTFATRWTIMNVSYNPYVGSYHSVGYLIHPTAGKRAIDRDKVLTRIDDTTCETELGDLLASNYKMRLKVNPDNSVTITPAGVTPNIDMSYGVNRYDPVTKTFTLNYAYNTSAPRIIQETIARPTEEKIAKTGWKIVSFSSEEPAEAYYNGDPYGYAIAVIDDNINTFWHSQWDTDTPPVFPHWFVLDLGQSTQFSSIEVFKRQGNDWGQTKHEFFYSQDGTNWTSYGVYDMNPTLNSGQRFKNGQLVTARYIKYVALEGRDIYAFLGEINLYKPIQ